MSIDTPSQAPHSRHTAGLAALAVLVLAGSAALFVHSSCAPAGATRSPEQARQPEDRTPDPDPETVDLTPPQPRPRGAVT